MDSVKKCFKCGVSKPLDDFYVHPQMRDGHLNKCKACTISDAARYRIVNSDVVRARDRVRSKLKHRRDVNRNRSARLRQLFPLKYRAHSSVSNAVRDGRIKKPSECAQCGGTGHIEAHHDDYSRPLDVVWLCALCHKRLHRDIAQGNRSI